MKRITLILAWSFVASLLALAYMSGHASSYVQPLQCQATGIALNTPSTSATVQCPNVPPPITGSCTQGSTGDVSGYTAQCAGVYKLHSGGTNLTKGPSQYTYSFVFGDSWPGDTFGATRIFTIGKKQFLSIPFKPTPGHTVSFNVNGTYTLFPVTFSVSTSPGLFNNGAAGNGVICAKTNNPALKVTSNGNTTSNCVLSQNTTYWLNVIPAKYGTSGWYTGCDTSQCQLGVTLYSVN